MTVAAIIRAAVIGALAVRRYFDTADIVWLTAVAIQRGHFEPGARVAANENGAGR